MGVERNLTAPRPTVGRTRVVDKRLLAAQTLETLHRCSSSSSFDMPNRTERSQSENTTIQQLVRTNSARRWKSFDELEAAKDRQIRKSIAIIDARIMKDGRLLRKRQSQLDREGKLWNDVVHAITLRPLWDPLSKQIGLKTAQMKIEMAMNARSVIVLNDMKTLISTNDENLIKLSRAFTSTTIEDRLYNDIIHRSLTHQLDWISQLQKHYLAAKDMYQSTGSMRDSMFGKESDSMFYLSNSVFEEYLMEQKFFKSDVGQAFDSLCNLVSNKISNCKISKSYHQIGMDKFSVPVQKIISTALQQIKGFVENISTFNATTSLDSLVEHLVFSRLGVACFLTEAPELDEKSKLFRAKSKVFDCTLLEELGLPSNVTVRSGHDPNDLFKRSIEAFGKVSCLFPSDVLSQVMSAIAIVHEEAAEGLELPCTLAADCLLPILVYILSRANAPFIHAQLHLLENYAIGSSEMGSEAAYYIACIRAAVTHIMEYDEAADSDHITE